MPEDLKSKNNDDKNERAAPFLVLRTVRTQKTTQTYEETDGTRFRSEVAALSENLSSQ